jgi:hypothetical protein
MDLEAEMRALAAAPLEALLADVLAPPVVEPLPSFGEETQAGFTVRPHTGRDR